jgi:hypothetical protein
LYHSGSEVTVRADVAPASSAEGASSGGVMRRAELAQSGSCVLRDTLFERSSA